MGGTDHHDVDRQVKIYWRVFGALTVLTIITVAVSYLHLSIALGIAVALLIAFFKGSLVACYFMHLMSEKKMIYMALLLTLAFLIMLLFMPVWWHSDTLHLTK